ncbi:MAG: alpha/beta hydrolase [Gammaproteobacteria bacterium]
MYLVTNRGINRNNGPALDVFGDHPNTRGPNELRIAHVTRKKNRWHADVLEDELTRQEAKELIDAFDLPLDPQKQHYIDLSMACKLAAQAREEKRSILFFVHGYNNDVEDVLNRAHHMEKRYGVIVVPFSWPADGGGLKGVANYKNDKNDAKASVVALDRMLGFINRNLVLLTSNNLTGFWHEASRKHPKDLEKRDSLYARLVDKHCPFTINLMLHSMGNYVLKQMLKSSISVGTGLTFDNILMVAADTNNLDHSLWVDRLHFRRRLYITINEDDNALAASRMKSGQDQLSRLGHTLSGLMSTKAKYINFTNAPYVGNSHAYFEGNAVTRNKQIHRFFRLALNGKSAEEQLVYRPDINCYDFPEIQR